ncbi:transposase IS116/IS110/IS902 family protein [Caproiciproducens galactitolivorans]|uniref:Transposase IS116/IS110/IS902 family protein n=1 Tax=Caproiciproducens galactitolivorans TaxID=642589 RepID=A0A4Z0YGB6_9FIRM|nr:transposase IS116/IS110/IS902 family protein [Caproiciproducens galactitolivorans]
MNFTQNEKLNQVTIETIVIGVDIGSETHYARTFDWRGIDLGKVYRFSNNGEGFAGFFAEVGDLGRFRSPKQIQKLAGLAIRENSSGKYHGQSGISKQGRRCLRALLFRAVLPLVATNREFAEIHNYYTSRKGNPLKKKQSLIASPSSSSGSVKKHH